MSMKTQETKKIRKRVSVASKKPKKPKLKVTDNATLDRMVITSPSPTPAPLPPIILPYLALTQLD